MPNTRRCAPAALALTLLAAPAWAQPLQLPRPSPPAKLTQEVGVTEITVEYSSPGVKGRPVWGALVPYGQLWRTGANAATKVTFARDVTVGGQPVPAGSYSLHTIPAQAAWTVILNRNPTASSREYKQAEDVARFSVTPQAIPHRERLAFVFANMTDDGATLDLEWEKLRVSIPIKVATAAQAMASIKALQDTSWRPYNAAARYLLDAKKELDLGLALVDRSIALKEDWFNVWTRAQLLMAKGKKKEARAQADRAYQLGKKADFFFFEADVKKALADWK